MSFKAGILVVRRNGSYKDIPGVRYHFPKKLYLNDILALRDRLVLLYEPRRGGTSESSGGRMGFVGFAFVDRVWDDPDDSTHAFLGYRMYTEFIHTIPLSATTVPPKSLQNAVRPVSFMEAEEVVRQGLLLQPSEGIRVGLVDAEDLIDTPERRSQEIVTNRLVRDASFRFRVVEQAYDGRCALTGVRMTNGYGRAEVDAAHIQPVANGGPDSTRNGLALMKSMHWAFDRGLVALSDSGHILTVDRGLDLTVAKLLPDDRRAFLPEAPDLRPHHAFLRWHREHVFKGHALAATG
ncbi:HNH endonuclease [Gemmatimonas sp.]|uniref:HNH endonuclease n=1 Tax=Gemmatimonas sp. TaxID=1962908 RepID=UPI0025C5FD25|nr:HNH endonuclease [Gemmatimonas sp.]MCA2990045.1 HNH endonuclease [Gemmatimonas sp.]